MATVTIFPSVSYSGLGLECNFVITSVTWATDSSAIQVKVEVQQSFDSGTTWDNVAAFTTAPGSFDKNGNLPAGGFKSGDALGSRLVRARATQSDVLVFSMVASIF